MRGENYQLTGVISLASEIIPMCQLCLRKTKTPTKLFSEADCVTHKGCRNQRRPCEPSARLPVCPGSVKRSPALSSFDPSVQTALAESSL